MAHHPSAKKRGRQAIKRRTRNRLSRGKMRTALKAAHKALEEGRKDDAKTLASEAIRLVDRAYGKGVIKRRTASRLVSKLTRRLDGRAHDLSSS